MSKVEQLCIVCHDPGQMAPGDGTPLCLDASNVAEGTPSEMEREATKSADGVLLTWHTTPAGVMAALYKISNAGMPVTTRTIASLCGGEAPFFWRPKQLESVQPDIASTVTEGLVGANLWTADGGVYQWGGPDQKEGEFTYGGDRAAMLVYMDIEDLVSKEVGQTLENWLDTKGAWCRVYSEPEYGWCAGPLINDMSQACPESDQFSSIEGEELASFSPGFNAWYLPGKDPVSLRYCPTTSPLAMAQYEVPLGAITVFPNNFDWVAWADNPDVLSKYSLAHEFGHARDDLVSGTWAASENSWAALMGMPAGMVIAIDTALKEHHVGNRCGWAFIDAFRAAHGIQMARVSDAYYHSPASKGEYIANLYALDFVINGGNHISTGDRAVMLDHIDMQLQQIVPTLATNYSVFPSSASELSSLFWKVRFDPLLGARAKHFGLATLINVARSLPSESKRYLLAGDPPLRCDSPSTRASFSKAAQRFLRGGWCYAFEDAINGHLHRGWR